MEHLTNVTITKCKELSSGEGEHGPWTLFVIGITGDKGWDGTEFKKFHSGDKTPPKAGDMIKHAELEEGDYKGKVQWTIKKWDLIVDGSPDAQPQTAAKPKPPASTGTDTGPLSMYVSYAKDIWCTLQEKEIMLSLEDVWPEVVKVGWKMKFFCDNPDKLEAYLESKKVKEGDNPL